MRRRGRAVRLAAAESVPRANRSRVAIQTAPGGAGAEAGAAPELRPAPCADRAHRLDPRTGCGEPARGSHALTYLARMLRRAAIASTIALSSLLLLCGCIVLPPASAPPTTSPATPGAVEPATVPVELEEASASSAPVSDEPAVVQIADELTAEAYSAYEFFKLVERGASLGPVLDSRDLEGVATTEMAVAVTAEHQYLRGEGVVLNGLPHTKAFVLLEGATEDALTAHVCADVSGVAVIDGTSGAELVSGDELGLGEVLVDFVRGPAGHLLVDSRTPVLEHERTCG
jgi:hypothetical protein